MRIGITTDTHANPYAQESVINYLDLEGIDLLCNLGDLVGMFPDVVPVVERAREECDINLMGNHDSILLRDFQDDGKRWERITTIYFNSFSLGQEHLDFLNSLPLEYRMDGLLFVHNSPFDPKERTKEYMHARLQLMENPSNMLQLSNSQDHVVIKGHSHRSQVYKIKRGLKSFNEGNMEVLNLDKKFSVRDTLSSEKIKIDPDFFYLIEVPSTCGANTMFTKEEDLDYRPGGALIEYDSRSSRGEITLFKTLRNYDINSFIKSVKSNKNWIEFSEAQKQIRYLEQQL